MAKQLVAFDDMKSTQAEFNRLKSGVGHTTDERDPKKATAHFAKESEWSTRLSKSIAFSLLSLADAGC